MPNDPYIGDPHTGMHANAHNCIRVVTYTLWCAHTRIIWLFSCSNFQAEFKCVFSVIDRLTQLNPTSSEWLVVWRLAHVPYSVSMALVMCDVYSVNGGQSTKHVTIGPMYDSICIRRTTVSVALAQRQWNACGCQTWFINEQTNKREIVLGAFVN